MASSGSRNVNNFGMGEEKSTQNGSSLTVSTKFAEVGDGDSDDICLAEGNAIGESDLDAEDTDTYSDNEPEITEKDLTPNLRAEFRKEMAREKHLHGMCCEIVKHQLKKLDNHIKDVQGIPNEIKKQRREVMENGWPIKVLKSQTSPTSVFRDVFVASKPLIPGDLIYAGKSIVKIPSTFVKIAPKDSLYKTELRLFNDDKNIIPSSLCCFGCCQQLDKANFSWCQSCGMGSCKEPCSGHWEVCGQFSRSRRQLKSGGVDFKLFDVAVAKILYKFNEIRMPLKELCKDPRTKHFMETSAEYIEWKNKMNQSNMPFSYRLAPPGIGIPDKEKLIHVIFAVICVFGTVPKSNKRACYLFPQLRKFTHSCVSNTEVIIEDDIWKISIYASRYIAENELITVDLINKPLYPTPARQALLLSRYGIHCQCLRCMDPTEFGTYYTNYALCKCSNLANPCHPTGYLVPAKPELGNENTDMLWCTNRESYGCNFEEPNAELVEYEKMVFNAIKTVKRKFATEKNVLYTVLKKLYIEMTKETFHENFHIVQYVRKTMLKLISNGDCDPKHCLPCTYVHDYKDPTPTIIPQDARFLIDMYDQTAYLLKMFLAGCSRKWAYTMYRKAKKQMEYIECLAYASQKTKSELVMWYAAKVLPEFMNFWCIMNLYRNPVDAKINALNKKVLKEFNQTKYLEKLKHVLDVELEFFRKKTLKAMKLEMEDTAVSEVLALIQIERPNILMEALLEKQRQDAENILSQLGEEDSEEEKSDSSASMSHDVPPELLQEQIQDPPPPPPASEPRMVANLPHHAPHALLPPVYYASSNISRGNQMNCSNRNIPVIRHGHRRAMPRQRIPPAYIQTHSVVNRPYPFRPTVGQRIWPPNHHVMPQPVQIHHLRAPAPTQFPPHPLQVLVGRQMPMPIQQPQYPIAGRPGYQQNFAVYTNPQRNFYHPHQSNPTATIQQSDRERYPSRFY